MVEKSGVFFVQFNILVIEIIVLVVFYVPQMLL